MATSSSSTSSGDLGTVSWSVDAKTANAVDSTKALTTQLKETEKGFEGLDAKTKKTEKGLDKVTKATKKAADKAKKAEAAVKGLGGGFKTMSRDIGAAVATVNGPLGGISSRISSLNTLLTTGGVATTVFAAALVAMSFAIANGVKELDSLMVSNERINAIINATGAAAGKTTAQLEAQARSVALNTLASTEGIQKAQAVLLTFKSVSGDVFDRTIALSQDLASVMGTEASSAALQLGKALQDPKTGLSALTRSGVTFTESQKDMVDQLIQSGRKLEAQHLILEEIESQYGGVAEAMASKTLSGAADTFGQALDELTIQVAKNSGALTAYKYLLNEVAGGMLKFTDQVLKPNTSAEDFDEAMELMWDLADAEEKLKKSTDNGVYGERSLLQLKINRMKKEREELLKTAKAKALIENNESTDAADAIMKANDLRVKESKAAIALAKKTADAKQKIKDDKADAKAQKKALADDLNGYKAMLALKAKAEDDAAKAKDKGKTFAQGISDSGMSPVQELQEEQKQLLELRKKYVEDAAVYDKALAQNAINQHQAIVDATIEGNTFAMSSIDALGSSVTSVISGLLDGTMSAKDAMVALGSAILDNTVESLVKVGVQYAKNAVIENTIDASSKAAKETAAAASAAEHTAAVAATIAELSAIGAAAAIASTAAIPITGPALAPAAGATIGAAVLATGSSAIAAAPIAGRREHGGGVLGGQTYEVGEKNKPEMLMIPGNNGKVFSNAEMKGMMSGNSGNSNAAPIINNYAAGSGVSVQHERNSVTMQDVFNIVYSESTNPSSRTRIAQSRSTNIKSSLNSGRRNG